MRNKISPTKYMYEWTTAASINLVYTVHTRAIDECVLPTQLVSYSNGKALMYDGFAFIGECNGSKVCLNSLLNS